MRTSGRPLVIDASSTDWPIERADAVLNINMAHISPWAASLGLIEGAAKILPPGGSLILYGPWLKDEIETAPSNLAFDADLRRRDPAWGLRRVEDFAAAAAAKGLGWLEWRRMPANNLMMQFQTGGKSTHLSKALPWPFIVLAMDDSTPSQNRKSSRSQVLLTATLEHGGATTAVKLRNLSSEGALVESDKLPIEGTSVMFCRNELCSQGQVVWVNGRYAGIAFADKLQPEQVLRHVPAPRPKIQPRALPPGLRAAKHDGRSAPAGGKLDVEPGYRSSGRIKPSRRPAAARADRAANPTNSGQRNQALEGDSVGPAFTPAYDGLL